MREERGVSSEWGRVGQGEQGEQWRLGVGKKEVRGILHNTGLDTAFVHAVKLSCCGRQASDTRERSFYLIP